MIRFFLPPCLLRLFAFLLLCSPTLAQELDVDAELAKGWELSEQRQTEKAIAAADAVIAANPDNARAYYLRGRENLRLGKFEASVADFDKFLALDPTASKKLWDAEPANASQVQFFITCTVARNA